MTSRPDIVTLGMCCSGFSVLGTLVLAATFFLLWLHRATSSALALGAELAHTPGWAVGCWFVPFVNLWQPLQVVQALDVAAVPESELEDAVRRRDIVVWWALWIVGNVVATVGSS